VIARFGTPISIGWFVRGDGWWRASSITIPIQGPRATGSIYAASNSNDETNPHFVQLEVVQPDEEFLMNLLSAGPSVNPNSLPKFGQVYLVPLSAKAQQFAEILPAYYKSKLNLDVTLLPLLQAPRDIEDGKRHQLIAESLIDLIRAKYPEQSNDPESVFIGITDEDVYVRDFNWRFTFDLRYQQRFGIISLARLDPAFVEYRPNPRDPSSRLNKLLTNLGVRLDAAPLAHRSDPEIISDRLKKVTTKLLGLMYYRLEAGPLPFTVLGNQASIEEIDRAGEDILASDVPESGGGEPCLVLTFDAERSYHPTSVVNSCSDFHFRELRRGVVALDLRLGLIEVRTNDFIMPGAPRILLSRVYRNQDPYHHAFGIGTNHPYDDFLYSRDQMATVVINMEAGSAARFDRTTTGSGFNPDVQFVNRGNGGDFTNGQMYWKDHHFHVTTPVGATYSFQECGDRGVPCYMTGYRNPQGDELKFDRQPNGDLVKVESVPHGFPNLPAAALTFTYNPQHSITEVRANTGERIKYAYDDRQRLTNVEDAAGKITRYAYDDRNNLTQLSDGTGRIILQATSDARDRVAHLDLRDISYDISYALDETGRIVEADLLGSDKRTIKVYMLNGHYSVAKINPDLSFSEQPK
jgi:YD repeat-containing protein